MVAKEEQKARMMLKNSRTKIRGLSISLRRVTLTHTTKDRIIECVGAMATVLYSEKQLLFIK